MYPSYSIGLAEADKLVFDASLFRCAVFISGVSHVWYIEIICKTCSAVHRP